MGEPVTQFHLDRRDSVALVTMDDGTRAGRPNILGRGALESLARLLPELEESRFTALVITGKPGSFSGGADLDEFPRIETREHAIEGSRAGHDLFARVRKLPYPTVAAINAGVLGGGVELALHCDYRVIADEVRHVASPECLLGIVPAWGATQLAPRLIGPEAAVKLIVTNPMRQNKMLNAEQANELGLVDRVIELERLIDEAITIALEQPTRDPVDLPRRAARGPRPSQLDDSLHERRRRPTGRSTSSKAPRRGRSRRATGRRGSARRPALHAAGESIALRVRPRRAARPPRSRRPSAEPRRWRSRDRGRGLMAAQLATLFLRRLRTPVVLRTSTRRSSTARSRRFATSSPAPRLGAGSTTSRRYRSPPRRRARRPTRASSSATS
jgi:enoyl-CoA hydratase/carnithine racemase